jgi:hypothetical protein
LVTQTAALAFGGGNPGGKLAATESWNGQVGQLFQ